MDRWCAFNNVMVDSGKYFRCEVETRSGFPLYREREFLELLAELTMQRYETGMVTKPVTLPQPGTPNPRRTKHFYRRLFKEEFGIIKPDLNLITEASESLGLWLEWTRENTLFAEGGTPHNSDPAYDVLSIVTDDSNAPRLQVVQVKATKRNVSRHANDAITKFEELENGLFDAELSCRLELLSSKGALFGMSGADLLFDPERRYRVTLIHGLPHNQFQILTTFDEKIAGVAERRSAYLIRTDFDELWNALREIIYGQLT